uniref:Prospero domain-containing protein n=1 Tax=Electrophorus electricus TaxID=8005 RepID=A0AAY5EV85_ELEEL
MPDHDSEFLLNRQTKRRRVDNGVKRTVGSSSSLTAAFPADSLITRAVRLPVLVGAMNARHAVDPDLLECQGSQLVHGDPGESKSNVLRKLLKRANSYEEAMVPFPGTTIISQLLKSSMTKNGGGAGGAEPGFPGSALSSAGSEAAQEDACSSSSRDSPGQECPSPFARPAHFEAERLSDEHLRAKRARVENIIRGMSHSPCVGGPPSGCGREREQGDGEGEPEGHPLPHSPRDGYRENKRKQKVPQQQQSFRQLVSARKEQKAEERRQLKLQLEDMQKQLRQLQEKFFQVYDSTDSEGNDPDPDGGNLSEDSARSDADERPARDSGADRSDCEMPDLDPGHFLDRARVQPRERAVMDGERPKREGVLRVRGQGSTSMHAEGKQLAETLKQELNSAMSQVVDMVVKVFAKPPRPLPQGFPPLPEPQDPFPTNGDNPNFHTTNQRLQCFGDVIIPGPHESFGGVPLPSANDQTEALPLVVRKPASELHHHHHHQRSAVGAHGGHHHPSLHPSSLSANVGFSPPSFRQPFPLPLMGYPFQGPLGTPSLGYPGKDRGSPDSMDLSRETTSLRTKMASNHHLGHHRSCSPTHPGSTAEGLSLCLIKSECGELQDMSDISPYPGRLSPNHLKKAKLMFFYTRYPSSNMLKMFFSDVKFNRCITSQLIKWFSNFREFYYIQMEKFARQAINDGVTGADEIAVARDCELFRALNMHYNKANDFEVPERFLEVAQITLREFFNAIVAGKDVDPSWKKAIYKVICKLDSEVPEVFKSPTCLQELLHE